MDERVKQVFAPANMGFLGPMLVQILGGEEIPISDIYDLILI